MGAESTEGHAGDRAGFVLYWLAAVLLFLPQVAIRQIADPDLWGRISVGAVLSQTGHLPVLDDFSYVARGAKWIDHEWLSGVIFFQVLEKSGEAGLHLLKFALIGSCFLIVFLLHRHVYRVRPLISGLTLIVLAPAGLVGFITTLRAQSFSIPLVLLCVLGLEAIRLRRVSIRHLAWLVPIAVFWGNVHGGVAMGLLAVAVYGGSELLWGRTQRALFHLLALVAMVVSLTWLNPYGPEYMAFLTKAWGLDRSGITEWQPLLTGGIGLHNVRGVSVASVSLVISIWGTMFALKHRGDEMRNPDATSSFSPLAPALLIGLWLVMTLMAQRIVPFLALTLAALLPTFYDLPGPMSKFAGPQWMRGEIVRVALPGLLCLLGSGALSWVSQSHPLLASVVPSERNVGPRARIVSPEGAVRYLLESPFEGKLLNPFSQGEFLYWVLYPKFRVASDGRYEEVYSSQQFWKIFDFYHEHPRGHPERTIGFANRSGADFVLFRTVWKNLAQLASSPEWQVVYRDEVFALLARKKVLAAYPGYRGPAPPMASRTGLATIADYFDDFESRPKRFADYP
jgi:hypothetical protein